MNPPSALASAMGRDRKPFTYTPGGLDLSEIKSERMAKRLMRNAMNQGLPELPQHIQSPPATSTPIAVPNFNCLPVQVFPINLPANPKSLLRTRSVPGQPREPPLQREAPVQYVPPPPQYVNNTLPRAAPQYDTFNKNTPAFPQINNNRPAFMYECAPTDGHSHMNYGSGGQTVGFLEPQYDAQFYNVQPSVQIPNNSYNVPSYQPAQIKSDMNFYNNNNYNNNYLTKDDTNVFDSKITTPLFDYQRTQVNVEAATDVTIPAEVVTIAIEEDQSAKEQKEVKIVSKQVKKESNVEEHNGDQNGDGDTETELVVKLPTKKSAAKTETKVEVLKKILPDGSVEEVKKTTTKTTIDGRTEIKTKTETRILPKEEAEEEEEEEEEEVEEVENEEETNEEEIVKEETVKENGHDNLIKSEEKSETFTITKKSVTVQENTEQPEEEEEKEEEEVVEEEEVEVEPVTVVLKKPVETSPSPPEEKEEVVEEVEEENEVVEEETEEIVEEEKEEQKEEVSEKVQEEEKVSEEIETESQEPEQEEIIEEGSSKPDPENEKEEVVESKEEEEVEEKVEEQTVEETTTEPEKPIEKSEDVVDKVSTTEAQEDNKEEILKETQEVVETKQEVVVEKEEIVEPKAEVKEVILKPKIEQLEPPEQKIPLREPSVPLERVEDVEIKPIGASDFITKSHTESTEIIRSTEKPLDIPAGTLSTSTEYNRTENIVTVNRTIKTLDNTYESMSQSLPPVKSLFIPHVENITASPQSRPYQPVYAPEPPTERRHSLLLERLSMERQMPTDIYQNTYQYSNQTTEQQQQQQWAQEPQAEVLTVSNVKPSMITNSQWYQQTKREVTPNQSAPTWQPQPQAQPQPQYQPQLSPRPQSQQSFQSQPQYEPPAQPHYQQQHQPTYRETTPKPNAQMYSSYTSQPTSWSSTNQLDTSTSQTNQYSFKEASPSYQPSSLPYSSSYVPPPWEQDSTYVVDTSQNYFQPPPQSNSYSPAPNQGWKPTPAASKFTKPTPTAYIPPKPNQSFVKPVINVEPPKTPGRKTYYSEYERRYISVPESTYIPAETKFQPQPDPSPQYYYDNNEPAEQVEHEWRKELREFTEKTQTQTETNVKPPWETETKFVRPEASHTPTPTWSQTLRPQSWRERSFESEYVSQTNTLGRGRPLSSIAKETIPERTRGVSVDRYNPNSYQPPVAAEHPPVQTYTHNPPAPHASGYHNPNVPAYHSRASAEPREQPIPQARVWRDLRASPFQSRSFKYLQWITGTED